MRIADRIRNNQTFHPGDDRNGTQANRWGSEGKERQSVRLSKNEREYASHPRWQCDKGSQIRADDSNPNTLRPNYAFFV